MSEHVPAKCNHVFGNKCWNTCLRFQHQQSAERSRAAHGENHRQTRMTEIATRTRATRKTRVQVQFVQNVTNLFAMFANTTLHHTIPHCRLPTAPCIQSSAAGPLQQGALLNGRPMLPLAILLVWHATFYKSAMHVLVWPSTEMCWNWTGWIVALVSWPPVLWGDGRRERKDCCMRWMKL